jgi:hypothetical protein
MYNEGDEFTVICKRCNEKHNVVRNWGGGIRIDHPSRKRSNPAICSCGSRQLELY